MVDLDYALKSFNEYIKEYPDDPMIKLKIEHMFRVMKINLRLAEELGLSQEDIQLAGLIGLLHDIGRFEQVRVYNTFVDKDSINHAMYSSEQLFQKGLIRRFIRDDKFDFIIKKAIENHNKFAIEENLDDRTLLHCKMIRDADKCDIYEVVLESDGKLVFDGSYDSKANIAPKVLNEFFNHKGVKTEDMRTVLDDYVRKQAFIFGLYFNQSLSYICDNDYPSRLTRKFLDTFEFEKLETIENIKKIEKYANDYIVKNRIDTDKSCKR